MDGVKKVLGLGPTREDVLWTYRTLLGREPESEDVIRAHLQQADLRALIEAFTASNEYRYGRAVRLFHPMPLPASQIDVEVDGAQLQAAVAHVRDTWSRLGTERPHFSVITDQQFLPQRLASSIDHFWASGDVEAAQMMAILAAHGVATEGKVCVEYGCGVGRVTGGLARQFSHVHAFDISPSHLQLAGQRLSDLGYSNVTLTLCSDTVVEALPHCDVYYSRIVLQHNPPPLILALLRSALAALNPGGIAIFQVPTYCAGYSFDICAWLAAGAPPDMEMHCLPQPYIFSAIAQAGCMPLDVREDDSTGDSRFISNIFVARRPAASATPASLT
jgi:SAM-dependent methyltransferase